MKITPLDIHQQQFKGKVFGGLDPEDVDAFLQLIAQDLEDLIRENSELKEQGQRFVAEMEDLKQKEVTLRETMLAAQRITEEMKANAQKEAAMIVSEAELKAEKILVEAENKLVQLNNQIQDLRREKVQFESGLKGLLDTHYKMLALNDE